MDPSTFAWMEEVHLGILGCLTGFTFYCFSSPAQGANPHRSCILPIPCTTKAFHLHQWNYLLLLLPLVYPQFFLCGFCVGGIVQSFVWYTDSLECIVPRERSVIHTCIR
jgi:hypothetical protein